MILSAVINAANSAGTAGFAVESRALAASESIDSLSFFDLHRFDVHFSAANHKGFYIRHGLRERNDSVPQRGIVCQADILRGRSGGRCRMAVINHSQSFLQLAAVGNRGSHNGFGA